MSRTLALSAGPLEFRLCASDHSERRDAIGVLVVADKFLIVQERSSLFADSYVALRLRNPDIVVVDSKLGAVASKRAMHVGRVRLVLDCRFVVPLGHLGHLIFVKCLHICPIPFKNKL